MSPFPPELSIIVPVLNEAAGLPALFAMLGEQQGVRFEVILSDGGSTDGTPERAAKLAAGRLFSCTLVQTGRGRGRQLNAGAAAARGDLLLFLHADSRFTEPPALANALAAFSARTARRGNGRVAGRFALRFDRADQGPSFAYHFYESKARLDRPGCIHGDQGFLLSRTFFAEVGPFDETLGFLEDDRLAAAVRRTGEWFLLPAEIRTSARRFETEGLRERQTLNALLMNFAAIGWEEVLQAIPDLYRQQDRTGRLALDPFFREIRRLLGTLPRPERFTLWYRTGNFVRANAWQLAFAWRTRRAFRQGLPPAPGPPGFLTSFDRWFDLLTDHPPGRLVTAGLVWGWFHLALFAGRRTPRKNAPEQGEHA